MLGFGKKFLKKTKGNKKSNVVKRPAVKLNAQYGAQQEKLLGYYRQIPCNAWEDHTEKDLNKMLTELQSTYFSDALINSFTEDHLKKLKESAQKDYEAMGRINRTRLKSLIGLSDQHMQHAIFESLFLFDLNDTEHPEQELAETEGFDDSGKPILEKHLYTVFHKDALNGVAGTKNFLPESICSGDDGMDDFLSHEYTELSEQFGKTPDCKIKAISTIGSLGGIGHKSDSDMDAQVIFDTSPEYNHRWNDADFFIALIAQILDEAYVRFTHSFPESKRTALEEQAKTTLRENISSGLTEEEIQIIDSIFPSSYQALLKPIIWEKLSTLAKQQQTSLFWESIQVVVRKYQDFKPFSQHLLTFFPFLKAIDSKNFQTRCFPQSGDLHEKAVLLKQLSQFYKETLGKTATQKVLLSYAEKHDVALSKLSAVQQNGIILSHLEKSASVEQSVNAFLKHLEETVSYSCMKEHASEIYLVLQKRIDPKAKFLVEAGAQKFQEDAMQGFRNRMTSLIEFNSEHEAMLNEAAIEYPIHRKIHEVEAYMTQKYPNTEVHYFSNFLRNQRAGRHTPFLVSPEGSMAYSFMLNDVLLNPATLLAGITPLPFDLPKDFRVFAGIGVFPASEWTLSQTLDDDTTLNLPVQKIPNWGGQDISREFFHEHVIPIFLRESEKVSHRNLPKALLNCWWMEMVCCLDDEEKLTSLTRLLLNPDSRQFIRYGLGGEYVESIRILEEKFPLLLHDPWWIKFTEMLLRFQDPDIQTQMVFCFAQHIRLGDIIDFNNDANPVYIEKTAPWRTHALVEYYKLFFKTEVAQQELMDFSRGRDDIANRVEDKLKKLFLQSMLEVEQKLIRLCNQKTLKSIAHLIFQTTHNPKEFYRVRDLIGPQLKSIYQRILVVDDSVQRKAKAEIPLNDIEKKQIQQLIKDRHKIKAIAQKLVQDYQKAEIPLNEAQIAKIILHSRPPIAGDALENVIFKHHFEHNFNRKPFQVPLPISKSLGVPRSRIMLEFYPKANTWHFKSVLSRKEKGDTSMFQDTLVDGVARCLFSGYVGLQGDVITSFQKPPARSRHPVAQNHFTPDDVQLLASSIKSFFKPFEISSREILSNQHYIHDIFMVCNVNYFRSISLIIRDNFQEHFVVNFDLEDVKVSRDLSLKIDNDDFFQRLNSKKCRLLFFDALRRVKIPLSLDFVPRFGEWININNLHLPVAEKFKTAYLRGIVQAIWPADSILSVEPVSLSKTYDVIGKEAVEKQRAINAEKEELHAKLMQRQKQLSRAYMKKVRSGKTSSFS